MLLTLSRDWVSLLTKEHDRSQFDCDVEALNLYLRQRAGQEMRRHVSATFVLLDHAQVIRGFYTLSSASLPLTEIPVDLAKKLPRYNRLPVTLLGRLAVDRSVTSKGVGKFLLLDALRRSLEGARTIGAVAVVVDPKDDRAGQFYRHFGFRAFQSTPQNNLQAGLLLPMEKIARIFKR